MISVQSRQQPLSGNNLLKFVVVTISLFFMACAPQIVRRPNATTDTKKKTEPKEIIEENNAKKTEKEKEISKNKDIKVDKIFNIALLMPFKAEGFNIPAASNAQLQGLDLAVNFYQGFLLGMNESLKDASKIKLNVYDSRDDDFTLKALIDKDLLNVDLIIGPVFPRGIKYLTPYTTAHQIPLISPLAATSPTLFKNPELLSVIPNIAVHAQKLVEEAGVILKNGEHPNLVMINPNDAESALFANELKKYITQNIKNASFSEYRDVATFEKSLVKNANTVVIVTAAERAKIIPILNELVKLNTMHSFSDLHVLGHPNWFKHHYTTATLSNLKAIYTISGYQITNEAQIQNFKKAFKSKYTLEPNEYAYQGYDLGAYIATLYNKSGKHFEKEIVNTTYKGIYSDFQFLQHPVFGFINVAVKTIAYENNTYTLR